MQNNKKKCLEKRNKKCGLLNRTMLSFLFVFVGLGARKKVYYNYSLWCEKFFSFKNWHSALKYSRLRVSKIHEKFPFFTFFFCTIR